MTLLSPIGPVRFSFDVNNPDVNQRLIAISQGRIPIVDVRTTSTLALLLPDKHGRSNLINLDITQETVSHLKTLSGPSSTSTTPTFVLQSGNQTLPLWLNLDEPNVGEYLNHSCMSSGTPKPGT